MKIVAFLICSFIFAQSAFANAHLVFVKGKVIRDNKLLKKDDVLNDGDKLSVDKNSIAVVEMEDGSKIKINEKSQIIINKSLKNELKEVQVTLGSAFFKVAKKITKDNRVHFQVKAKQVSLGVRGTEFFVSMGTKKNDIWMCVNEGLVAASTSGKETLVKEGEGIHVSDEKISDPKPLPWTKKLNWSMDSSSDLKNEVSIEEAYTDMLGKDYD